MQIRPGSRRCHNPLPEPARFPYYGLVKTRAMDTEWSLPCAGKRLGFELLDSDFGWKQTIDHQRQWHLPKVSNLFNAPDPGSSRHRRSVILTLSCQLTADWFKLIRNIEVKHWLIVDDQFVGSIRYEWRSSTVHGVGIRGVRVANVRRELI